MPTLEPILPHVVPLMLVVARVTGIFVLTPLLGSSSVPTVYRAMLAFMFSIAIYSSIGDPVAIPRLDLATLVPLLFIELMIGVIIGLIAAMPIYAMQMGGYIMGYQVGLSLAESFNPELNTNGSVIGQILFFLGVFLFIGVGGLDVTFLVLADSLKTAPIGAFGVPDVPLGAFVDVFSSGFELAIRISTPIMAAVSMSQVAMGLVMKTMPQINIMSVGFGIQIVVGLLVLSLMLHIVGEVASNEIDFALDTVTAWVHALAPSGGQTDG